MYRFIFMVIFLFSNAMADGTLRISAVVSPQAAVSSKMTLNTSNDTQHDLYLQTNHEGILISLSQNEYTPQPAYVAINQTRLGEELLPLSDELLLEPEKVGELTIAKEEGVESIGITLSAR